jgi:predicted Zn finger-like uncharacterized protein
MLIVCPNCETSYEVSPQTLGETGRTVRCARCHQEWFAAPSALRAPAKTVPEPVPAAAGDVDWDLAGPDLAGPDLAGPDLAVPDADASVANPALADNDVSEQWGMPDHPSPPLAPTGDAKTDDAPAHDIETLAARRSGDVRRPRRQRGGQLMLPVVPTIIAVELAAIFAIVVWRAEIVRAMPQTASLFRAIGLPVNLRGLELADISVSKDEHDGVTVLIVDGTIENNTRSVIGVPRLRFALRSAAYAELISWTAPPDKGSLGPGETLAFRSRLASPPHEGKDILVRFLNRQDFMNGAR